MVLQRTRLDCGVCALAMLLDLGYDEALGALVAERERTPSPVPDPLGGNGSRDLWMTAIRLGRPLVYVDAGRWGEAPPIEPETCDGIYLVAGNYGGPASDHHFVFVERGQVHDPFDGSVTPWPDYASAHAVVPVSVLYPMTSATTSS